MPISAGQYGVEFGLRLSGEDEFLASGEGLLTVEIPQIASRALRRLRPPQDGIPIYTFFGRVDQEGTEALARLGSMVRLEIVFELSDTEYRWRPQISGDGAEVIVRGERNQPEPLVPE